MNRNVEEYLRELADAAPGESNRSAFARIAGQNGMPSLATLYRYVDENDAGDAARTILDALDARRIAAGAEPTTIADFRNLTAGRGTVEAGR